MVVRVVKVVKVVHDEIVADSTVDHARNAIAKVMLKVVDKPMVAKAMKMADKRVADHHVNDASTANQEPAAPIRYATRSSIDQISCC